MIYIFLGKKMCLPDTLSFKNKLWVFLIFKDVFINCFRGRKRERGKHRCESKTLIGWLLYSPGIEPATFQCLEHCPPNWAKLTRASIYFIIFSLKPSKLLCHLPFYSLVHPSSDSSIQWPIYLSILPVILSWATNVG